MALSALSSTCCCSRAGRLPARRRLCIGARRPCWTMPRPPSRESRGQMGVRAARPAALRPGGKGESRPQRLRVAGVGVGRRKSRSRAKRPARAMCREGESFTGQRAAGQMVERGRRHSTAAARARPVPPGTSGSSPTPWSCPPATRPKRSSMTPRPTKWPWRLAWAFEESAGADRAGHVHTPGWPGRWPAEQSRFRPALCPSE